MHHQTETLKLLDIPKKKILDSKKIYDTEDIESITVDDVYDLI